MSAINFKTSNNTTSLIDAFKSFIIKNDHPCIMAKTAVRFNRFKIKEYNQFGSFKSAQSIYSDLLSYIDNHNFTSNHFESFVAVFPKEQSLNEKQFEHTLWKQLMLVHTVDKKPWDDMVSKNPESRDFSFSIGGHAFYVIGLHPSSSRAARRFKHPALVFNFHCQFEQLRKIGTFKQVRDTIRARDKMKNGSVNPMVKDFGMNSEANQYSGRQVDETWRCPFNPI